MEPFRPKFWKVSAGRLMTCGRPGRAEYKGAALVPDAVIHEWVLALPGPNTVIVSLLGKKPWGASEFQAYPFSGGFEPASDGGRRPSFQAWLDAHHPALGIEVREHPTIDFRPIALNQREQIANEILELLAAGKSVVLVDSGGQERTGAVCRHLKLSRDESGPTYPARK
jgi:hypothetical protein